jgi:hypothetical protein
MAKKHAKHQPTETARLKQNSPPHGGPLRYRAASHGAATRRGAEFHPGGFYRFSRYAVSVMPDPFTRRMVYLTGSMIPASMARRIVCRAIE